MNQFSWSVGSRFAAYAFRCFVYYICVKVHLLLLLFYDMVFAYMYNNVPETFLQLPVNKFKAFVIKKAKHISWLLYWYKYWRCISCIHQFSKIFFYACTYFTNNFKKIYKVKWKTIEKIAVLWHLKSRV